MAPTKPCPVAGARLWLQVQCPRPLPGAAWPHPEAPWGPAAVLWPDAAASCFPFPTTPSVFPRDPEEASQLLLVSGVLMGAWTQGGGRGGRGSLTVPSARLSLRMVLSMLGPGWRPGPSSSDQGLAAWDTGQLLGFSPSRVLAVEGGKQGWGDGQMEACWAQGIARGPA